MIESCGILLEIPYQMLDFLRICPRLIWNVLQRRPCRLYGIESLRLNFFQAGVLDKGCPISPYIFVLCMEKLGQLIHKSVEDKVWKPIMLGKNDPPLLHLFFVDDLFLFAEVDIDQARNIKDVLQTFGAASGHKVNGLKTTMFFSGNIDSNYVDDICSVIGFHQTDDLKVYLGLPFFHRRITMNTFKFVVDKVR